MPSPRNGSPDLRRSFTTSVDPVEAVRLQRLGPGDPTLVLGDREVLRATHSPSGPATLRLRWDGMRVEAEAWGDGAAWVLDRAPAFCGTTDPLDGFAPTLPWLVELAHRCAHVRLGRALRGFDTLAAYVLQQRVAFADAAASWRRLVERHGAPAPGPFPLVLPLTPQQWRALPPATLAAAGVDPQRTRTLREVALHAAKLDRLDDAPLDRARTLLPKLPGIGPWTSGMALAVGWADADAIATGDVRLPSIVSYAFAREPSATDARMLELLEPYRGHRFRVVRLLFAAGYHVRPTRGRGRGGGRRG